MGKNENFFIDLDTPNTIAREFYQINSRQIPSSDQENFIEEGESKDF